MTGPMFALSSRVGPFLILGMLLLTLAACGRGFEPTAAPTPLVTAANPGAAPATDQPTAAAATITPIAPAVTSAPTNTEVAPGQTPTLGANPGATATPTLPSSVEYEFVPAPGPSTRSRFVIGGIDFADPTHPLDVVYPVALDGSATHNLDDVDLLVSDAAGASLAVFQDVGSWVGKHKFFVYADIVIGSPILSVHTGYWAGTPMDSEPLRQAVEGPVYDPYSLTDILSNLDGLEGEIFTFAQLGSTAEFTVAQAIRMDAQTTADFLYRAGELSTLLEPVERPEDTVLWLMCSTGQPGESEKTFPARFVLALTYIR